MTALSRNPATTNNLLPNRFRFMLKRAPQVEFWVQEIELPGFSMESPEQPNPLVTIPHPGDHIAYETLGITMLLDEELANYREIHDWMRGLGTPYQLEEYAVLQDADPMADAGVRSEITVFLLNGQQQPKWKFTYHGAFPIALGGFRVSSTDQSLGRVVCHAAFKYSHFDLEPIS
jgi:hypothetical protein